eukprot:CAMPEP_0172566458 /NCGR_PEP_ID=MMETSP1067-20121228/111913_1 /TAXON_ID=265564 ORGANISM="Thalassiosira punctigera, Strain Tpunct2005C2" /NCGR_SAMPLE_ID=MMETSP1067 /ASSEMBLY_ACC=CAM_ASM_000444 /LENGTH=300 /DNA_ID=CAMNT_0013357577 /DNA_START=49 /DNA_END=948 /DNA_ORIENTATION=+
MDLTPKSSTPWRTLLVCCRPPLSDDADRKRGFVDEHTTKPTAGVSYWLKRNDLEKEKVSQQIVDLSTEIERAEEKIRVLSSELNHTKAELNDAKTELDNAASQVQEQLKSELKLLKTKLLESEENESAKSLEAESLQRELRNVRKSLVDATTSRDALLAEKDSVRKRLDNLSAVKDSMESEMETLKSKLAENTASKESEVGKLLDELKKVSLLLYEATTARDDFSGKNSSLSQILVTKEAEAETLKRELMSFKKDSNKIKKRLAAELKKHRSRIKANDNSMEELSAQLNAAQAEKESLRK